MGILITVLCLGIVIFIHELGHMLVAKWSGVGVLEFAIGMGPKIWGRKIGNTLYSLRALPFGGFVKLAGIDDGDEKCEPEISFYEKPLYKRFLTIAAGSMMNILLGFVIFVSVYCLIGVPQTAPLIQTVLPASPALAAGFQKGDRILSVNGNAVSDVENDFVHVINRSAEQKLLIEISRDGAPKKIEVVPKIGDSGLGLIGVELGTEVKRYSPIRGLGLGLEATARNIGFVFHNLAMIFSGKASLKEMAGPIGIVQFASFSFSRGILQFMNIIAMISISLGVINLFPFPVLDGGHLIFLLYEAVFRKPVNKKWEVIITNIGAAVLVSLMVFIVANDVVHWKTRIELLKKLSD
jgi:regulator of sigma E protease